MEGLIESSGCRFVIVRVHAQRLVGLRRPADSGSEKDRLGRDGENVSLPLPGGFGR
jgi:hypothetical protein